MQHVKLYYICSLFNFEFCIIWLTKQIVHIAHGERTVKLENPVSMSQFKRCQCI